jgi:chaperonin GroES
MALNIKPLSDRVLIEPVAAETKTASGILFLIPLKKTAKGTVVAVGDGTKEHTMTVLEIVCFTGNIQVQS